MKTSEHVETIAAALEAARARNTLADFLGEMELYCENSDCAAREVTIVLKELDGPTTPACLRCPACRRQLKLHHVATLDEAHLNAEAEARRSVNEQLYVERERQRLGDPRALIAVPLGVFLDDRLPRGA